VLEQCAWRVTEVERQVLDKEKVVSRSTSVALEPVVLEPHVGVGVPIVSWHIGRRPEARGDVCAFSKMLNPYPILFPPFNPALRQAQLARVHRYLFFSPTSFPASRVFGPAGPVSAPLARSALSHRPLSPTDGPHMSSPPPDRTRAGLESEPWVRPRLPRARLPKHGPHA
jgi:hypothetical protein